ncbi:MAG: class I SAM-dependent methyltransferase [Halobacteriovoraceae bacterium]|nr:class I SAM-dependent methyltransferase [Halobacteriovoraceae bacterium]
MSPDVLFNQLVERKSSTDNQTLLSDLSARKKAELEFHNRDRDKEYTKQLPQDTYELLHGNKKYYKTIQLSRTYVDNWIKTNAKGKIFLDYACGNGGNAMLAARSGAALSIGIDISDISIKNATNSAKGENLNNTIFVQGDCENTGLPDNSIDTVICSGMLHHLDLSYAFPELRRILKPGGRILAVEALNINPLIKLYRFITPSMRTDWEKNHILSLKDIRFARRFFNIQNVKYWHIFSYFSAFFHKSHFVMNSLLTLGNFIDSIATKIPFLQLMAWQFTFELVKRNEE